jgi:hypothetical protein
MPSGMRQSIEKISRVAQADYVIGARQSERKEFFGIFFGLNSSRQLSVRPLCKCQSPFGSRKAFRNVSVSFSLLDSFFRGRAANVTDTLTAELYFLVILFDVFMSLAPHHQAKREIRIN